jgi:hypothetical protein
MTSLLNYVRGHRQESPDTYLLEFVDGKGQSWAFDCDENGTLTKLYSYASLERLTWLKGHAKSRVIGPFGHSWWEPAYGNCRYCGKEVVLDSPLDNECECGVCYNGGGDECIPSWRCYGGLDGQGEPIEYEGEDD